MFLLLALSLLASAAPVAASAAAAAASSTLPPDVIPANWQGPVGVDFGMDATPLTDRLVVSDNGYGMMDRIHVVGFSPGGRLAVLTEQADEAVGGYLWDFEIIDLRTDAVLVSRKWSEDEFSTVKDLDSLMVAHQQDFASLMRQQDIQPQSELGRWPADFIAEGRQYHVGLKTQYKRDDMQGVAQVSLAARDLGGQSLGSKILGTAQWTDDGDCCGKPRVTVVPSPYEARVAVIVSAWSRGYEGPPHVLKHTILGALLLTGLEPSAPTSP